MKSVFDTVKELYVRPLGKWWRAWLVVSAFWFTYVLVSDGGPARSDQGYVSLPYASFAERQRAEDVQAYVEDMYRTRCIPNTIRVELDPSRSTTTEALGSGLDQWRVFCRSPINENEWLASLNRSLLYPPAILLFIGFIASQLRSRVSLSLPAPLPSQARHPPL